VFTDHGMLSSRFAFGLTPPQERRANQKSVVVTHHHPSGISISGSDLVVNPLFVHTVDYQVRNPARAPRREAA